jgi:hypothetical protein
MHGEYHNRKQGVLVCVGIEGLRREGVKSIYGKRKAL